MYVFFISFLAGISTLLGFFVLLFNYNDNNKIIGVSMAFASGVMISVSFFDLIPSSVVGFNNKYYFLFSIILCLLFVNVGIILSKIINNLMLRFDSDINKLYKTGIFSMFAIILHNIPEDCIKYVSQEI